LTFGLPELNYNVPTMTNTRSYILGVFCVCFALVAASNASQQQGCDSPCGKPTTWQDFNGFTLKASTPGQSTYYKWQGNFDEKSSDIQVDVEYSQSGPIIKGKILMIGGRVMAMQGPIAKSGYEIDTLDAAILELQLVKKLLGRALPSGPASVSSEKTIDYADN